MSEIKESLKQPIIIDLGSSEIKAGFSGEDKPSLIFKSFIGEPKYKDVFSSIYKENKEIKQYIGEDCLKNIGLLKLHNPIKHGILVNEQEIIPLFNHIYSKLGINTDERKEHPHIITEPLLNPYSIREKIANSLFDYIGIPSIFFASQPILSLFSTSATTGIILESGEGVSQSCIIYEGYSLPNTYERYDFGGGDVTLGDERILASEILFNPELIGKEYLGLSDIIFSSINKAEIQLRPKAFENIVLSGGNVLMRGLEDKMKEDIINKCNKIVKINVSTVKEPQISCWVGGNIISSIDIFKKISVSKTEWEEKGSKILHVKTI